MVYLSNGKFCTGSADSSIKIWDKERKECIQTLTGHEKWVKCVFELDNGIIVSGSDDNSIRLWKPNRDGTYTFLHSIEEHIQLEHFAKLIQCILPLVVSIVLLKYGNLILGNVYKL